VAVKITEHAELTVNGQIFRDWESVMVRHALNDDPPFRFRFTCSEGLPLAKNFALLRIRPGMECTVKLAGILAISGRVFIRQAHYNARQHSIEIQGWTYSADAAAAAVTHQTMEFKKVGYQQLASTLLKSINVPFQVVGGALPNMKFDRISITPGESIRDVLERYARPIGAALTSNPRGDFVAAMGWLPGGDAIIEGINIIEARGLIQNLDGSSSNAAISQEPGTDNKSMSKVSHMPFFQMPQPNMMGLRPIVNVVLSEIPGAKEQLQGRTQMEDKTTQRDEINVVAVVHGWLKPSGGLWEILKKVYVKSPMLIMDQPLYLRAVTFEQSSAGSRSTLDLIDENALGNFARIKP